MNKLDEIDQEFEEVLQRIRQHQSDDLSEFMHMLYAFVLLGLVVGAGLLLGLKSETALLIFSVFYYLGYAALARIGATSEIFRQRINKFYFKKANFSLICLGIFDLSLISLWLSTKSSQGLTQAQWMQVITPTFPIFSIFIGLNILLIGAWFWLRNKYFSSK